MEIKFYIQAEPNFKGQLRVKEWFRMEGSPVKVNAKGHFVPDRVEAGYVDEDVIKQNPKEYKAFKDLLSSDEEKYYGMAREKVGNPVYLEEEKEVALDLEDEDL